MSIAEKLTTIAENEQKVYDAGAKSEYDMFWDNYQSNGTRTAYLYGFAGEGWNDETFKPKYDIVPTTSNAMFNNSNIHNLKQILKDCGVTLDFSQCDVLSSTFYNSKITYVGTIDTSNATTVVNIFTNSTIIHIDKIILPNNINQRWSTLVFSGTPNLEYIRFEGSIKKDLTLQWSPKLTLDSIKNILTALYDFSEEGTTNEHTIYLSEESWALIDADGATSPTGTTWKQYVTDKGWKY